MASTLNADNGVVSGTSGIKYTGDATGDLAIQSSGNTVIYASNTGNVGVGTNSPTCRLDVSRSGASAGITAHFTNGDNDAYIYNTNASICKFTGDTSGNYGWGVSSYNGYVAAYTNGAERVRVDSSGNMKMITANTKLLNSSGNPMLMQTGTLLQRRVYSYTTQQVITSQSFADIFTASFTPVSSTSRIYISCNLAYGKRAAGEMQFPHRFLRNGSAITQQLTWAGGSNFDTMRFPDTGGSAGHMHVLYQGYDEPATTSAITYSFQILKTSSGYADIYINFNGNTGSSCIIIDEISQ